MRHIKSFIWWLQLFLISISITGFISCELNSDTTTAHNKDQATINNSKGISDCMLEYCVQTRLEGWQRSYCDDLQAGSTGNHNDITAIQMKLLNTDAGSGIRYRIHAAGGGWRNWEQNWSIAEYTNWLGIRRQVEAIQIQLINPKPGWSIKYRAYVREKGWLPYVQDGMTAGTTGESRRMEAIRAYLDYNADWNVCASNPPSKTATLKANRSFTGSGSELDSLISRIMNGGESHYYGDSCYSGTINSNGFQFVQTPTIMYQNILQCIIQINYNGTVYLK